MVVRLQKIPSRLTSKPIIVEWEDTRSREQAIKLSAAHLEDLRRAGYPLASLQLKENIRRKIDFKLAEATITVAGMNDTLPNCQF